MLLSPKRPDSEEQFSWDCRADIIAGKGGSIASIVDIYEEDAEGANVTPSSVAVLSIPLPDATGYIITAMLGGGTAHQRHKMTAEFITTQGEHLFHTIEFLCLPVLIG